MSSFSSSSGNQESESRSNPNPKRIYDVFLSFCGKDIGESFTSYLCTALTNAGVNVFWHYDELRSGDRISPSRLQAIERSRISVIVFSTNYANSRRCLQELEKIIECRRSIIGQEILPVFYDVDPSDVCKQRGIFGEAFEDLIQGILVVEDEVMSWRAGLREASNISGFVVMDSRNESALIENVVERVSHLLEWTDLFVAKHPVGVKSRVQDVLKLLNYQESKDVILLGIWGMEGIGKTTIAKAIYNEIGRDFEGRSFLPHIDKVWEQDAGLVHLQERLLFDISKTTKTKMHDIASGEITLKKILHNKRILLVLDDVSEFYQLDALFGSREWFGLGSIIIITTRDRSLLSRVGVYHLFEVKLMDMSESVELLSWHAFKQAFPTKNFFGLSRYICKIVPRVPLALEVLGSFLFDREIKQWETVLDDLEESPTDKSLILKISFDGLEEKEKEIFLEIICFYIGMDRHDVIQKLNDFGHFSENGVGVLVDRSLVTVDEKNKLGMHDLLEEMGRNIIFQKSGMEPGSRIYDVFLSFRGEDTRATFTSHLYTSLQNAGIYVFRDDDEIQRGDQVSLSLMQAIGRSSISVIVLSRNYANSRWCLQELESILESHRTMGLVVVPVFYGVDPSEVRNQTGMFGQAFKDFIRRISVKEDKERSWKKALLEVGGIAGFVVLESRNESEDIKKVVEHVTRLLDRTYLFVAKHPVGVESRVQDVIKLLNSQQSKDPLLLGIWGMGGIGKTTIAKAIYNQIGRKFENRSFLLNVREVWEQDNGGVHLQKQLLSDIYKTMNIEIHNIELGKSILEQRLGQKRVLLVLDDVDKLEQLNALFGSHKWFAPESIIIITTRDKHLLSVLSVDHLYRMKKMDEKESIEFFSWHAFKQASPQEEFAALSSNVIAYSGGLPLALEVLGSYLFGRGIKEWESVLEQLKSIPNDQVQKKLKISFDGLSNDTEREIFLDVAFFFIGIDRNDAVDILNGCWRSAEIGISVLVERSLITIDSKNKLRMHDLLRDMGREIIREKFPREPEERSRLWHPEEVLDVLSKDMGTKAVQGLALKLPRMKAFCLNTKAFKEMKRLRLLQLAGVQLDGDFKYLSRDLRWLSWHGFPSTYTPTNFDQGNLVGIDLKYSNLQLVWKKSQLLEKLKILNLSHSHYLTQTPDFLNLPNLEKLILKDCTSLSSVSHTIGHLNRLLLINLKGCPSLRELPRSIYKLKSLKTFILSGCLMIDKLEEDLEQMESLTTLIADSTAITQVPYSVVRLKSIGYISLCGYEGFSRDVFPSIIWSLSSPTNNLSSPMQTSAGMSSPVSLDVPNSSLHGLSSIFSEHPMFQSLRLERGSELQITEDIALDTLNATNYKELEATPTTSQVSDTKTYTLFDYRSQVDNSGSKISLNSFLIQMGMNCPVTDILRESIFQKLTTSGPGECLLPSDKNPDWLTFNGEGSSVIFEVPKVNGRNLKTMTLCIVYSSGPDIITSGGLKNLLIINYTKASTQVYERDALTSFVDEEWQSVISNLEPGNKVQVVVFGDGFNVKKTAVYLIYDEPIDETMEQCYAADKNVIVSGGNDIVNACGGDDMSKDKNVIVPGGDDVVADKNVNVSGGDDMATDNDVIVHGSDDMPADETVNACDGDDMSKDKNVIVPGGDDVVADKNVNVSGGDDITTYKNSSPLNWLNCFKCYKSD